MSLRPALLFTSLWLLGCPSTLVPDAPPDGSLVDMAQGDGANGVVAPFDAPTPDVAVADLPVADVPSDIPVLDIPVLDIPVLDLPDDAPPDAATGDAMADGGDATACIAPRVSCPGVASCVDLTVDRGNCGACGHVCSGGELCFAGTCSLWCERLIACDGTCVNVQLDDNNCGACGNVCRAGEQCTDGACLLPFTCPSGMIRCERFFMPTGCIDLQRDSSNCGVCGLVCGTGSACVHGVCTPCTGATVCSGACASLATDPANCGACGATCGAPAGATASCTASACTFTCAAGTVLSGGSCVPSGTMATPRPIAPMPTSTVTTRRPTLHWRPAGGARIELCADRACTVIRQTLDVMGDHAAPTSDLPPGTCYWRVRGRDSSGSLTAPSATWQFTVGFRSAAVDASWGTAPDFNGDGYGDLLVTNSIGLDVDLFLNAVGTLPAAPTLRLSADDLLYFGTTLVAGGDLNGDGFGDAVVVSGGGLADLAGDLFVDVFFGHTGGPRSTPDVAGTVPTPLLASTAPDPVAAVGDVDGDGYADLVAGYPGVTHDPFGRDSPAGVYVFRGSPAGPSVRPDMVIRSPAGSGDYSFGAAVVGAGDVNGDGYADVLVGASSDQRAYLYCGGPTGFPSAPTSTFMAPVTDAASFGGEVAGLGDINGDGYADVFIADHFAWSSTPTIHGYIYLGSATGPSTTPAATIPVSTTYIEESTPPLGPWVVGLGDVDGDGYGDFAVAPPAAAMARGQVVVYRGGSTVATVPTWTLSGELPGDLFGSNLASGDVTGDGYGDLIVSAPRARKVYVFAGGPTGLSTTAALVVTEAIQGFGIEVE